MPGQAVTREACLKMKSCGHTCIKQRRVGLKNGDLWPGGSQVINFKTKGKNYFIDNQVI